MTIKQYLKKHPWNAECKTLGCRAMSVVVVFASPESDLDEVEFDIGAFETAELSNLFNDFCKENGYKNNTVVNIIVRKSAPTMEELVNNPPLKQWACNSK